MAKKKEEDLLAKIDELDDIEEANQEEKPKQSEKKQETKTEPKTEAKKQPKKQTKNKAKSTEQKKSETKKVEGKKEETKKIEKEQKPKEQKAIVKVEEPKAPTLAQMAERQKKKNLFLIIIVAIIVVLIMIFSVIFALMNVTKSVIINGVSIKSIDVSNLSLSEAKSKIEEAVNIELNAPIKLKADNYETTINTNQFEFNYNTSKAAEEAYSLGRSGNIFQNNYAILKSAFFGEEIDLEYTYNADSLNYIVNDIESKIPGLVIEASHYREENELIIIPGTDGIIVNKEELKNKILDTITSANVVDLLENDSKLEIDIPIEEAKAKEIDIEQIYSEIYTEPKDAYFERDPFKIYAEVEGVDFDISKEDAKQMVQTKQEEYRIPLKLTPASKTINDIGLEAFPYLISDFTTKYDASNINRSQNLAIAAGKIDGTVLMPGEEFSFNQVVGKRTIQEGYKDAKIYQDGQVVDGLAGGICQISSTLYNAVVKADLEVTERRNHSFTTSYIKAGQDATVVYGVIDFKFKNTRTYPIKISASVESGIAEFKINGIKEEVEYDISLNPVTTGSIPYSTQYVPDATLAPGQQVIVQRGGNGLKVTTYKDKKLDGKLVFREVVSTDTYRPMNAIIRIGQ